MYLTPKFFNFIFAVQTNEPIIYFFNYFYIFVEEIIIRIFDKRYRDMC